VDVRIVMFPETRVAALEHRGPPPLEHESIRKLIEWRQINHLHPVPLR
jgi:AraC family transcriptional regulator